MSKPIRIQIGEGQDVEEVMALVRGIAGLPRWSSEVWHAFTAEQHPHHAILLVARDPSSSMVGCLAASGFAESVELELMASSTAHRREGIAASLTEYWLSWARQRNVKEALLEVRESNGAARSLYGKLGFEVQGRRRSYYREPTEDAICMRLQLLNGASRGEPARRSGAGQQV